MDLTPQTTTQRAGAREARIKAYQAANANATLLAQQQVAAVVAQQQQTAENSAAATLLAQKQAASLAAQQQQASAATLLPQKQAAALSSQQQQAPEVTLLPHQQAEVLVDQQQAAVLTAQQQLAAAQAALAATTPTVPTGQPPTRKITFSGAAGFALNPAMANQGILDYTTTGGRKVYETATRDLSTVGYYCDPNGLYQEVDTLSERSHIFGWINLGVIM